MSGIFNARQRPGHVCDDAHWTALCRRLSADPRDPDALFAYAAYLASWHQTTEAMQSLEELSKVNPDYPGLMRFKARLFKEMGKTDLASECLRMDNDPY